MSVTNRTSRGFDALREHARSWAESLAAADVSPRTGPRSFGVSGIRSRSSRRRVTPVRVDRQEIRKSWHLYRSTPLLRAPINQFSDDVVADGYRIEADDQATVDYLTKWCESAAVIAGERGHDLRELLRHIPIAYESKGTALIEHAPSANDSAAIAGLVFIPPETVTPLTEPGTNLLPLPDATGDDVPETDEGNAAAYIQHKGSHNERRLAADDVTKLANTPDPSNDVFGSGSVAAAAPRVEATKQRLADQDESIAAAAYPRWLFGYEREKYSTQGGGEDFREWDDDAKEKFWQQLDNLEPGGQITHDGPLDLKAVFGETPDITEQLLFDVDWIMSVMPTPKYAIGAFDSEINRRVTQEEQPRYEQRIETMRSRIGRALSPVLTEVARQNDYDASGVALKLEPAEDESPVRSLTVEQSEVMLNVSKSIKNVSEASDVVSEDALIDLVLNLPTDAAVSDARDADTPPGDERGSQEN